MTMKDFNALRAMHNDMPRRWKVITWAVILLQILVLIANAIVGDWSQVFDTTILTALFMLCALYSMIVANMLKVIDEQESHIKAQNSLIKSILTLTGGPRGK